MELPELKQTIKRKLKLAYRHRRFGPLHWPLATLAYFEKRAILHGYIKPEAKQLPTTMLIGNPKCGTTWLYEQLKAHPDCFVPRRKEIHFFNRSYDELMYFYYRWFNDSDKDVRLDATPVYIALPNDRIRFIHEIMPDARLIVMIRNPMERDWSDVIHGLTRKDNPRKFEDVPYDELLAKVNEANLMRYSDYSTLLQPWLQLYGREQILILFYDDISNDPKQLLSETFEFMNLSTDVDWSTFPFQRKFNANPPAPMPDEIRRILHERYINKIDSWVELFGNRVRDWHW